MNIFQRFAKNTLSLLIMQFVDSILSIVLAIAIARYLGDVIFGKFSFAFAFVSLYILFSNLGYDTVLIREVARDKSKASKYLNNIMSIRVLLSLIIFALIVLTINIMEYSLDTKIAVYLLGIYLILVSLSNVFRVTFRAFERMEYEAGITILVNIIRVSFGLLILFLGYGLIELVLIYLLSGIVEFTISFFVCEKKFVKIKPSFDLKFLKTTIKTAVPIGLLSMFALIYVRIDTIMLSVIKGDAVVGWYNAAYNLARGFKPIPHLFMTALFPLMSYYYISSKESLKIAYEKSFKYLFILGLPISVGITLLSKQIILAFYGQQFNNSIIALQILSWDILLIFLYSCAAFLLVSMDKQNQMAIIAGCTALINVVLNLVLIPKYSYIGAAIATITTEIFLLTSYIYLNYRHLSQIPINNVVVKSILACGVMGLFIYQFQYINLFLLISISILIYFAILFLIKGFTKDDIAIFKKLINR